MFFYITCFAFLASRYFICLFVCLFIYHFCSEIECSPYFPCAHTYAHRLMMCDVQRFAIFEMISTYKCVHITNLFAIEKVNISCIHITQLQILTFSHFRTFCFILYTVRNSAFSSCFMHFYVVCCLYTCICECCFISFYALGTNMC